LEQNLSTSFTGFEFPVDSEDAPDELPRTSCSVSDGLDVPLTYLFLPVSRCSAAAGITTATTPIET
jgi:hypothetical protein